MLRSHREKKSDQRNTGVKRQIICLFFTWKELSEINSFPNKTFEKLSNKLHKIESSSQLYICLQKTSPPFQSHYLFNQHCIFDFGLHHKFLIHRILSRLYFLGYPFSGNYTSGPVLFLSKYSSHIAHFYVLYPFLYPFYKLFYILTLASIPSF